MRKPSCWASSVSDAEVCKWARRQAKHRPRRSRRSRACRVRCRASLDLVWLARANAAMASTSGRCSRLSWFERLVGALTGRPGRPARHREVRQHAAAPPARACGGFAVDGSGARYRFGNRLEPDPAAKKRESDKAAEPYIQIILQRRGIQEIGIRRMRARTTPLRSDAPGVRIGSRDRRRPAQRTRRLRRGALLGLIGML